VNGTAAAAGAAAVTVKTAASRTERRTRDMPTMVGGCACALTRGVGAKHRPIRRWCDLPRPHLEPTVV
jgi:hypothetical protein